MHAQILLVRNVIFKAQANHDSYIRAKHKNETFK